MIVWGGFNSTNNRINTGGKYNPQTDTWAATTTTSAPSPRNLHTSIWSGQDLIVWGGDDGTSQINTGGRYCPGPVSTPTPSPSPTPTPTPSITISGTVSYCSNPTLPPVPGTLLTLIGGGGSHSTTSDGSGNYSFVLVPSGANYTATPSKTALAPGSAGITAVDILGIQRHSLNLGTPLAGCRLTAADVNGDGNVTAVDVIATQRFFLGLTTGTANVGKYQFSPASRTYTGLSSNQTGQNYDAIVFGDVAASYVH